MCREKIHGNAPWSFQYHRKKSELDQSVSEDKNPKKLNIWCTKSIFICFIAVGGILPSTVCQVQLLHLREPLCFSREFLHQGLHMDFTLNSYWIKDKQCLDWGLELRPLFHRGLPSCCIRETYFHFSIWFKPQTSDFFSTTWYSVWQIVESRCSPPVSCPSQPHLQFVICSLTSFHYFFGPGPVSATPNPWYLGQKGNRVVITASASRDLNFEFKEQCKASYWTWMEDLYAVLNGQGYTESAMQKFICKTSCFYRG